MKTKNTLKAKLNEQIKRQGDFLKKCLFLMVIAAFLSVLSGCQDQMASIKIKSFNYPVLVNEITTKSVPAQLASTVTFNNESNEEISEVNDKDIEVPVFREFSISQYSNTSVIDLESYKEPWKETYDGKGLPLLRISF